MVSTLAWNLRDVGSIPTLGVIFPIFITPTTYNVRKSASVRGDGAERISSFSGGSVIWNCRLFIPPALPLPSELSHSSRAISICPVPLVAMTACPILLTAHISTAPWDAEGFDLRLDL